MAVNAQNAERAAAIIRVRKLMDQTTDRGRTEAEMNIAMSQMSRLMTAFNLTMNEVTLRGEEFVTIQVDTPDVKRSPIDSVICAIASFCDCRVWRTRPRKKWVIVGGRYKRVVVDNIKYNFFGLRQDTDMAEFLFNLIRNTMDSELAAFKRSQEYRSLKAYRGQKRSASHSFGIGFARRISSRLTDMKIEMNRDVRAGSTGTDLVFIKKEVVNEQFKNLGMKLVKTYTNSYANNATGYSAGRSAGDRINLLRPIQTGGNNSRTLALSYS